METQKKGTKRIIKVLLWVLGTIVASIISVGVTSFISKIDIWELTKIIVNFLFQAEIGLLILILILFGIVYSLYQKNKGLSESVKELSGTNIKELLSENKRLMAINDNLRESSNKLIDKYKNIKNEIKGEIKADLERIEEELKAKGSLKFEQGVYWFEDREGNKEEVPYCPHCYDSEKLLMHLKTFESTRGDYFKCNKCKNLFDKPGGKKPERDEATQEEVKSETQQEITTEIELTENQLLILVLIAESDEANNSSLFEICRIHHLVKHQIEVKNITLILEQYGLIRSTGNVRGSLTYVATNEGIERAGKESEIMDKYKVVIREYIKVLKRENMF